VRSKGRNTINSCIFMSRRDGIHEKRMEGPVNCYEGTSRGEREMKVTGCTCRTGQTHIPRDNPVTRSNEIGTKSGVQVISVISESLQVFFGIVGQEMKCLDDSRRW